MTCDWIWCFVSVDFIWGSRDGKNKFGYWVNTRFDKIKFNFIDSKQLKS
jgi:hypothetical protein